MRTRSVSFTLLAISAALAGHSVLASERASCAAALSRFSFEKPKHVSIILNAFVANQGRLPNKQPKPEANLQNVNDVLDEALLARAVDRERGKAEFWESLIPTTRALLSEMPTDPYLDKLAQSLDAFVRTSGAFPLNKEYSNATEDFQETVLARNMDLNLHRPELFFRLSPRTQELWVDQLVLPGSLIHELE